MQVRRFLLEVFSLGLPRDALDTKQAVDRVRPMTLVYLRRRISLTGYNLQIREHTVRALFEFFWQTVSAKFRRRHSTLWTMQNTKGFEQHELDIINEVRLGLVANGTQESDADQIILDAWTLKIQSADDLRRAVSKSPRPQSS